MDETSTPEMAKARDILAAVRVLKQVEREHRAAAPEEPKTLARFCGFGPVALPIFPEPVTGKVKDGWQATCDELRQLLADEEYESAKRSTFNAFYTCSTVIKVMHAALARLGVPSNATVPGPGLRSATTLSVSQFR